MVTSKMPKEANIPVKEKKAKKVKPIQEVIKSNPISEPEHPVITEPPKKRKLSEWQKHVQAFAKENKCGRELFKKAYATYKPTVASTKA
jgi:hypothetical protein